MTTPWDPEHDAGSIHGSPNGHAGGAPRTRRMPTTAVVEVDRQAERDAWQTKPARMNQLLELGMWTGATAHAVDVAARQGAIDVELTYPDERRAALDGMSHAGGARRLTPPEGTSPSTEASSVNPEKPGRPALPSAPW